MERVLVIDDEQDIRQLIRGHLERAGLQVTEAESGRQAISLIQQDHAELMILDLMMDDGDGFDVLEYIRRNALNTFVIALSARNAIQDKIDTLGFGADDYVTKPFSPLELVARVQAHLRRLRPDTQSPSAILHLDNIRLNINDLVVDIDGNTFTLTPIECELLKLFIQNPDRVMTKTDIYQQVWNHDRYDDNNLSVYISRLRSMLGDVPDCPRYLQSIRGIGYRFSSDGL